MDLAVKPPSSTSSHYLDWRERPAPLQDKIHEVFNELAERSALDRNWGINGEGREEFPASVSEYRLVKEMIIRLQETKKTFYIVDIGSGKGMWGMGLAKFLEQHMDHYPEVRVHIFSTRGEKWTGKSVTNIGLSEVHELGTFSVENMIENFQREGWDLAQKVDLVASSWCLRHLVDPLGTFLQMYHLLRPEGYCAFDGFFFSFFDTQESLFEYNQFGAVHNILQLLLHIKAPFLVQILNETVPGKFILKKPDATACQLPIHYEGFSTNVEDGGDSYAGSITIFKYDALFEEAEYEYPSDRGDIVAGSKSLYEEFKQRDLFASNNKKWEKIALEDAALEHPQLHTAVLNQNITLVEAFLKESKVDLNASDVEGNTPLHLAVQMQNVSIFELLLEHKARHDLFNNEQETPLHIAAKYDQTGLFLRTLLKNGAKVDAVSTRVTGARIIGTKKGDYYPLGGTPLERALAVNNTAAIAILTEAGADKTLVNCTLFPTERR